MYLDYVNNDTENAEETMEEVRFTREVEREMGKNRWEATAKAKRRLAAIAPIQNTGTTPIRLNRNGAYIRKGNRIVYKEDKIASRKNRREEGKAEIRRYTYELEEEELFETLPAMGITYYTLQWVM